jgi:alpha-ketoglutarate-dependent taurine dioxygenase
MEPRITPTGATLGAVVSDIELAKLEGSAWKMIEAAFHEHAVLIFPGQGLSAQDQITFAKHFGEIEILTPDKKLEAVPIANVRADGSRFGEDDEMTQILRGNEGWHTDSSYMPLSAKASVLSAHVVPSKARASPPTTRCTIRRPRSATWRSPEASQASTTRLRPFAPW